MCPQPEVSTALHVHSPVCPRPDESTARCVHSPMCPQPDVSTALCVHSPMCPQPKVSTALHVHNPMCPQPDVSTARCVHSPKRARHGVPRMKNVYRLGSIFSSSETNNFDVMCQLHFQQVCLRSVDRKPSSAHPNDCSIEPGHVMPLTHSPVCVDQFVVIRSKRNSFMNIL